MNSRYAIILWSTILVNAISATIPLSISFGEAHEQGRRPTMQDATRCIPQAGIFVLCDGHGGLEPHSSFDGGLAVANTVAQRIADGFLEITTTTLPSIVTVESIFTHTEQYVMVQKNLRNAGSTAVAVVIKPTESNTECLIAWTGDSRALIMRNGLLAWATKDHRPDDAAEYARITQAGGTVIDKRVDGFLAVTRAFGDYDIKRGFIHGPVTHMPELIQCSLQAGDIVVIACDGVFDSLSNEDVAQLVHKEISQDKTESDVAATIVNHALWRGSTDNVSAIVIKIGQGEGNVIPFCPNMHYDYGYSNCRVHA
jgi:serine/threonine protein phosphatase PrpC